MKPVTLTPPPIFEHIVCLSYQYNQRFKRVSIRVKFENFVGTNNNRDLYGFRVALQKCGCEGVGLLVPITCVDFQLCKSRISVVYKLYICVVGSPDRVCSHRAEVCSESAVALLSNSRKDVRIVIPLLDIAIASLTCRGDFQPVQTL
jgi:hypothetical protein